MGFPLRSNIFRLGTFEQRQFARFPLQTSVLFSATSNREFSEAFGRNFFHLDQITGDDVVFFAVMDPPKEWRSTPHGSSWLQHHYALDSIASSRLGAEDDVLVHEIARIFGVEWHDLPVLVASPNLWLGEYCIVQTNSDLIEGQFQALINLVRQWGRPNLGMIQQAIEETLQKPLQIHTPRLQFRNRMTASYQLVESALTWRKSDFTSLVRRQVDEAQGEINRYRWGTWHEPRYRRMRDQAKPPRSHDDFQDSDDDESVAVMEAIAQDAAGKMAIPATLALQFLHQIQEPLYIPTLNSLDPESIIFLETALRVGDFLERQQETTQDPLIRINRPATLVVDFTASAAEAWKAFEREINLSVIQAARACRGIPMPAKFALFDAELHPQTLGVIGIGQDRNGRPRSARINQLDWERSESGRHRFLELGISLEVYNKLRHDSQECFLQLLIKAVGSDLPSEVVEAWRTIQRIRNPGSHTERIILREYETVLDCILGRKTLPILMNLKRYLLNENNEADKYQVHPQDDNGKLLIVELPSTSYSDSKRATQLKPTAIHHYGEKVKAILVEDPKGKKRPWAKLDDGCFGPILKSGTPQSTDIGDSVQLLIHAVHHDHIDFCWPDAPYVKEAGKRKAGGVSGRGRGVAP